MPPTVGFIGTWDPAGGGGGSIDNLIGIGEIFDINRAFLTEDYDRSILTVDQMAFANLSDGPYIGRTHLSNNLFSVENIGVAQPKHPIINYLYFPCISSSGEFMAAAGWNNDIYISTNWGITWNASGTAPAPETWNGIAMSGDGKIIAAVVASGANCGIWMSRDYGASWGLPGPLPDMPLTDGSEIPQFIAMSTDGKYILVAAWSSGPGGIYRNILVSRDYGVTWIVAYNDPQLGVDKNYRGAAISSDGKIMLVSVYSIVGSTCRSMVSYNYGVTWAFSGDLPVDNHYSGAHMSANGRHMLIGVTDVIAPYDGGAYISNDYGQTWVHSNISGVPNSYCVSGGVSADGRIMVMCEANLAQLLYVSEDYGATWSPFDSNVTDVWFATSFSSDGNILLVSANSVLPLKGGLYVFKSDTYISASNAIISIDNAEIDDANLVENSYTIWVNEATGFPHIKVKNSLGVAIDTTIHEDSTVDTYQKTAIDSSGSISTNYGGSIVDKWRIVPLAEQEWWGGLAMSATGQYIYAGNDNPGPKSLWRSTDYGQTFAITGGISGKDWRCIQCSANGKYVVAMVSGKDDPFYVSNDYGVSFAPAGPAVPYPYKAGIQGIAISSTGQYMAITTTPFIGPPPTLGNIWISTDYGVTWIARAHSAQWNCIAMSNDGSFMVAGQRPPGLSTGKIYTSYDYGITWNLTSAPDNLWTAIAMSGNGEVIYANQEEVTSNGTWRSIDYGFTWEAVGVAGKTLAGIATSTDGRIVAVAYYTAGVTGCLYISTDYATSWILVKPSGVGDEWNNVVMSKDGRYMAASHWETNITNNDIQVFYADSYTHGRVGMGTDAPSAALDVVGLYPILGDHAILCKSAAAAPADAIMDINQWAFWHDEATDAFYIKSRRSDGSYVIKQIS